MQRQANTHAIPEHQPSNVPVETSLSGAQHWRMSRVGMARKTGYGGKELKVTDIRMTPVTIPMEAPYGGAWA